jgi:hypothetical protein
MGISTYGAVVFAKVCELCLEGATTFLNGCIALLGNLGE